MTAEQFNNAVYEAHSILEKENTIICVIYFESAMNAFEFHSYLDDNGYWKYLTLNDKIVVVAIDNHDPEEKIGAKEVLGYILSNVPHTKVSSIKSA